MLTFIGGAAVGTLVTYLAKNEEARKNVEKFIDGMGSSFIGLIKRLTPEHEEQTAASETETTAETPQRATPASKTARPRRAAKPKRPVSGESPIH
jgi:hypothetical protein